MMVTRAMVMLTTLTNASTRLASRATPLKLGKATSRKSVLQKPDPVTVL